MIRLALLCTSTLLAFPALASERAEVCARPAGRFGESQSGYKVEATIATGSELNTATRTFDYQGFSTYVVIFWDRNQATIIQMDSPYFSIAPVSGVDQEGRAWTVTKNTYSCFR